MTEKWKSTIGIELQELLRGKKISQRQLAAFLGVEAASVTYLFQGKIKLTRERLEQIMLFLHAEPSVVRHLEELFCQEVPAPQKKRSEDNLGRFSCRCRLGLTPENVSEQSGISVERLKELENSASAVPSAEEVEALKKIYGCEAGVLWGIVPPDETPAGENSVQIREPGNSFSCSAQVSLIDCNGLVRYRAGCDFPAFLKKIRSREEIMVYDGRKAAPVAKVLFSASRLGWDTKGTIEILLGMPESEAGSGLYLGRGVHGRFRLWKRRGRIWIPFFSVFGERKMKPAWFLPVTDFFFHAES